MILDWLGDIDDYEDNGIDVYGGGGGGAGGGGGIPASALISTNEYNNQYNINRSIRIRPPSPDLLEPAATLIDNLMDDFSPANALNSNISIMNVSQLGIGTSGTSNTTAAVPGQQHQQEQKSLQNVSLLQQNQDQNNKEQLKQESQLPLTATTTNIEPNINNQNNQNNRNGKQLNRKPLRFKIGKKVNFSNNNENINKSSALTELIKEKINDEEEEEDYDIYIGSARWVEWTIYVALPQKSERKIRIKDSDTVNFVIHKVIELERLDPNKRYELRLHEGEGEPDTDFPPLIRERLVKEYGSVDCEYCLVLEGGQQLQQRQQQQQENPINIISTSNNNNIVNNNENTTTTTTTDTTPTTPAVKAATAVAAAAAAEAKKGTLTMAILIANSSPIERLTLRNIDDSCTVRDLLPRIAKYYRLRLYTDDYIFTVSSEDKIRLKWMYRYIHDDLTTIASLCARGVRELELKKKEYADSIGVKPKKRLKNSNIIKDGNTNTIGRAATTDDLPTGLRGHTKRGHVNDEERMNMMKRFEDEHARLKQQLAQRIK